MAMTRFVTGGVHTIGRGGGGSGRGMTTIIHETDPSLVLDLQFRRDAAFVSRRGPLPTFTRASVGYCVNSAGLIVPAAINTPRIDYDPATLASRGLLLEEQRTNLALRSEDITTSPWSAGAASVAANQTTSPDGAVTADSLAETTANAQHFLINVVSVTSGTAYTASLFVKKGNGATAPNWIALGFLSAGFGSARAAFNVQTGLFGNTTGITSTSVTQFANGWWRIAVTATATTTTASAGLLLNFTQNNNSSSSILGYAGQTTSDVFVWGAQFEAGAFATSYIPTTSAAVIRSADVCSITGSAFSGFWNALEGTIVIKFRRTTLAVSNTTLSIDDGTANERIVNLFTSGIERFSVVDSGGGTTNNIDQGFVTAVGLPVAHACRMKANDYAFSCNGIAPVTNIAQTMPTVTQMTIGQRIGGNYLNGWIQALQYFNRAKTNAQLQALSTP